MSEDDKPIDKWKALIIISLILAGSYLYVQSQKLAYSKMQYNEKQTQRDSNVLDRAECLDNTDLDYSSLWESNCKGLKKGKNCALPLYLSDRFDKEHQQARSECIRMYPVD